MVDPSLCKWHQLLVVGELEEECELVVGGVWETSKVEEYFSMSSGTPFQSQFLAKVEHSATCLHGSTVCTPHSHCPVALVSGLRL